MINYTKASDKIRNAWFTYKESKPGETRHLVDFAAGYNAALEQLPNSMKHCTIEIEHCEVGHTNLTSNNWTKHPCKTCEIERLKKENSQLSLIVYLFKKLYPGT